MLLRSSISAVHFLEVLLLATLLLATRSVTAKDQIVDWTFGMLKGGGQVDVLQCQSVTFDWTTGDGMPHDVWEFASEEAFDNCDFNGARELKSSSDNGKFVLQNEDTLGVTKRWFGCKVGAHCTAGKMKIAVKIRPLMLNKFYQSECVGGTGLIARNEPTEKACRKRCKRKRGCIALEYNTNANKNCKLYSEAPERRAGRANTNAQCEIAATSCDAEDMNSQDGGGNTEINPAPAVPYDEQNCQIDMNIRCKFVRDTTVTNIDCENIPMEGQCKVKVRYLYYIHTLRPGSATLKSLTRTRNGADRNLLIAKDGTNSVGQVVSDWTYSGWEEEEVDLCSTNSYDTKVTLFTEKASTGQKCVKSQSVKFATDASDAPAALAPGESACKVKMTLECVVCITPSGCDGTDCNFYADDKRCNLEVGYKYSFANEGDSFITVKQMKRKRTGESELLIGGSNYIMPKGNKQFYGEPPFQFNFCNNGVKDTVFEAQITCGGVTETHTVDYSLAY